MLIDTQEVWCEVHRRLDETRWQTDLFNRLEDVVTLESVGFVGPLEAFYAGLGMEDGVPLAESGGTV